MEGEEKSPKKQKTEAENIRDYVVKTCYVVFEVENKKLREELARTNKLIEQCYSQKKEMSKFRRLRPCHVCSGWFDNTEPELFLCEYKPCDNIVSCNREVTGCSLIMQTCTSCKKCCCVYHREDCTMCGRYTCRNCMSSCFDCLSIFCKDCWEITDGGETCPYCTDGSSSLFSNEDVD